MQKCMEIARNNCHKGKINCLQWLLSGYIRSDDDRTSMESGGNWDLQIGCANHGIAFNKKSKYWTFNSNHANIKALVKLQETFDVPRTQPDPPPSNPRSPDNALTEKKHRLITQHPEGDLENFLLYQKLALF